MMSCIRANFPALPDHDGIFAAPFRVIELEKPTDKKFDGLVQLPSKTKSTTGNGSAPLSPLESKALTVVGPGLEGDKRMRKMVGQIQQKEKNETKPRSIKYCDILKDNDGMSVLSDSNGHK